MADFFKFRTSLNGFNRSDVTEFIENLCTEHQKELEAAAEGASSTAAQAETLAAQLEQQIAQNAALRKELEETKEALAFTQEALEEALTTPEVPETVEEEPEVIEEEPVFEEAEDPVQDEEKPVCDYTAMELEAYRRAEAMERSSNLRAARLHQQLDAMMEQISNRCGRTGQDIQVLAEDIRINLKRLDETLSDLDAIFDEAKDGFDAMEETFPAEV